jgi:ribonuclease G
MKGTTIILDHWGEREAAARLIDGQLDDVLIDSDLPRPGSIYRAIAERPMKGQGGMFLKTPDGMAFLRQVKGLSPGDALLVQVTGYAEPGKALPVTTRLLFKSRYAIVTPGAPGINVSRRIRDDDQRDALLEIAHEAVAEHPLPEGAGLILRSGAHSDQADEIFDDILAMSQLAQAVLADDTGGPELLVEGDGPHALAWREWSDPADVDSDPNGFARHEIVDLVTALASPRVPLAPSGSMMIEPTSALVAVDINTGGDTSPAAGLKANIAAFRDLPRQLRLRGLGGQIVIDPAPVAKRDRSETVVAGWTVLGLLELQRKRDRVVLKDLI